MSDSCCSTPLETEALHARQRRVLLIVMTINMGTFVMMVTAALVSGSSALLSGTLDNFGDAVTYALSFACVGASNTAKGRVALFKGLLIMAAAAAVAMQIAWRLLDVEAPLVGTMSVAAALNLAANAFCLWLLTPLRHDDVNMASVWECSRNDVFEGVAVIAAAVCVWWLDSGWPDLLIAIGLLLVFTNSAVRVLATAWRVVRPARNGTVAGRSHH